MSKVIKAHFIIKESRPLGIQCLDFRAARAKDNAGPSQEILSQAAAAEIYTETKQMMEEVLAATKERAEGMLAQAGKEAKELLEESRREALAERESARREGYAEGYGNGCRQLEDLLLRIAGDKNRQLEEQQEEMVKLIFITAEKILGAVLEIKPEVVSSMLGRILEEVKEARKVTLKVNPAHIPYLHDLYEKYNESNALGLQIAEDPELEPGDCIVITDSGFIEARIAEQLETLKQELLGAAGHVGL